MKTFAVFLVICCMAALTGGVVHDLRAADANGLPAYDTLEEAGVHAILRARACSIAYECGGAIALRPDGKYVVGPVYSDAHGDDVSASYAIPEGLVLAAGFHTHPCLPDTHVPEVFSPNDIASSLFKHVPEFMGDLCTGEVHEFNPLTDRPDDFVVDGRGHVTKGRIVGRIPGPFVNVEPKTGF